MKQEIFNTLISEILEDAFSKGGDKVEFHDYFKFKISYITEKDIDLIFLFVTGLTDNFDNIKKELIKCKKEFLNLFEDILQHRFDAKTFEVFDPTIDAIHRNLRPKISLVGFSGVGKTTITKLIKAEEIPMQHIPTITGDIATIKIGKLHFHLWDFAGQEQFSYLWNNFIKGSDAVLLVTDSSLENVEKSKFFLELIKEQAPHSHTAVIANKQDLKDSIKPPQIEKVLGLKTYSMIAKDDGNRDKMIQIIADVLDMSAEVSPLLKPLLQRDKLIEDATNALESTDFEKSAFLFEKISDLCLELGDDSLGKEFFEKAQKIKAMLSKVGAPQPTPAMPLETDTPRKTAAPKKAELTEAPVIEPSEQITTPEPPLMPPVKKVEITKSQFIQPPEKKEIGETPIIENLKKPEAPRKPITAPPKKPEKLDYLAVSQVAKTKVPQTSSDAVKPLEEPKKLVQPEIPQQKVSLKLDPKDFMVKQRPKTVISVPKDAKSKLKMSQLSQEDSSLKPRAPIPVSPKKLFEVKKEDSSEKEKAKVIPKITEVPVKAKNLDVELKIPKVFDSKPSMPVIAPTKITETPKSVIPESATQKEEEPSQIPEVMDKKQKENLKKALIDLKIKKANVSKMSLDLDMKELMGEITETEFNEKKEKLSAVEKRIDTEIINLEKILKD